VRSSARVAVGSLLPVFVSKNFVSLQKKAMMNCGCGMNPCKTYGSKNKNNMAKVNLNRVLDDMAGLDMYKGRLINNRPDGMMGIERAANMKRIIDEDRKIKMIADGIERAEMRKKYRSM